LTCAFSTAATGDASVHDYPTHARVEYVQECVASHGARLANVYQCSCAIDRIAEKLSYDDFVEASTFVKYAKLGGEAGGLFRDPEQAKKMVKLYHDLESTALRACGMGA
jgi:hypothetical protein